MSSEVYNYLIKDSTLDKQFFMQEPTIEYDHEYLGFKTHKSKCNVKIWIINEHYAFVIFTDLGIGTSVTNASEQLVEEVYFKSITQLGIDKSNVAFSEMYQESKVEDLDLVIPTWKGNKVINVNWKNIAQIIRK